LAASDIVNDELDRIDGLEIQDLRIEAGGLVFKGTLPQAARGLRAGEITTDRMASGLQARNRGASLGDSEAQTGR